MKELISLAKETLERYKQRSLHLDPFGEIKELEKRRDDAQARLDEIKEYEKDRAEYVRVLESELAELIKVYGDELAPGADPSKDKP
jgi:hypothetical protein